MELDKEGFELESMPGELKVSRIMLPLEPDVQPEQKYYGYYFEPVPEYAEEREEDYRVDGKLLYLELFQRHDLIDYNTRAVTSVSDFLYVWQNLAELEYGELPEGAYEPASPSTWLYASFVDEDGSVEVFGLGRDNYVYRAGLPEAEWYPDCRFTQMSAEPIPEIVHLHLVAEVFRYLHMDYDMNNYYGYFPYADSIENVYMTCGDRTLLLEDRALIDELEDLLISTRREKNEKTGEWLEYDQFLEGFEGITELGDVSDMPEGSIRIVLSVDRPFDSDPAGIGWGFYITPEGEAYNVRNPFAVTDYIEYYYYISSALITKTPDIFNYEPLLDFFNSHAE